MSNTPLALRLVSWNTSCLPTRIAELREFVSRHEPDIILLQETKLKPNNRVYIPNFTCYRNDRVAANPQFPLPKHGTAVFIRSTIPHHEIPSPELVFIQATTICVKPPGLPQFYIASVYLNNNPSPDLATELIDLVSNHNSYILCGDFNAHHRRWARRTNRAGTILSKFADENSFQIIAPPTPTRFGYNSQTTIDLILIRDFPYHHTIASIPELSSDHNPVLCDLFTNTVLPRVGSYKNTDWPCFTEELANNLTLPPKPINSPGEVQDAATQLSDHILTAHVNASREIPSKMESYTPSYMRELIKDKNRARKSWQRTRDPADKRLMRRLQNQIKTKFHNIIQNNWTDYLESLDPEDGSLFKMTKKCKRPFTRIPPLALNNEMAFSDNAKAEVLAKTYEAQFQNNPTKDPIFDNTITNDVDLALSVQLHHQPDPVEPAEIVDYINKIKIKKAPGRDGITNKMAKNLPPSAIITLAAILTAMLRFCTFPNIWKTAVIIPILKPEKNAKDPVSYRPISLLPILGKIAEVVIKNRLLDFLTLNNKLIPHQFGFMKGLSTTHQLLRVTEFISEGLAHKESTGAIFLDVAKAFDRVWIKGLVYKLIQLDVPPYLIPLINSYLTNRSFTVRVGKDFSKPKDILAGTPQGSVLGPILFNIYVNDIPQKPGTMLSLFADDTAILARSPNIKYIYAALQKHIDTLEIWLNQWKVKINVSKSAAVFFSKKIIKPPKLSMYGEQLNWDTKTRYLGVILDARLTWKPHFEFITAKFRLKKILLKQLLGRYSPLNVRNKLLVYKTILRPTITYAAPVWGGACRTTIDRFEVLQSTTLRHQVLAANRYASNTDIAKALNIPSLRHFMGKLAITFYNSLESNENEELKNLDTYDHTDPRYLHRPRASLALAL